VLSTLLDLDSDVRIVLQVLGQPDGGEMAPPELLDDHISVQKNFSDMDRVVAANFVIGHSFIFTGILVLIAKNS
jgi:hypothetical protein